MTSDASTILLKASAVYFAGAAYLHTHLSFTRLFPFFGSRAKEFEAFVFKLITLQLSGYFAINSILLWRWAQRNTLDVYDRAIMAILVGMNTVGGAAFVYRGNWQAPPCGLLLGTSAMIAASQLLRRVKQE